MPTPLIVPLSQGQFTSIDPSDWPRVSELSWYARKRSDGRGFYAVSMGVKPDGKFGQIFLHKFLLSPSPGIRVDHKDGNGLNNTRKNLRPATQQQNCFNRIKHKILSSGHKGVSFEVRSGRWRARITHAGKTRSLGYFVNEARAAKAYRAKARQLFGEFAPV